MMLSFQFSSSEHNHCLTQIYQTQSDANSVIKFPAKFLFFFGGGGGGGAGGSKKKSGVSEPSC